MRLHITTPCHETWEAMAPTRDGRHCAVCAKTVIDLVAMPTLQARAFLREEVPRRLAQGERICVRAPADPRGRLLHPGRRLLTNGMAAMLAMAMGGTVGASAAQGVEPAPAPTAEPALLGELCPPAPRPVQRMGRIVKGDVVSSPEVGTVTRGVQTLRVDAGSAARLADLLVEAAARCQLDMTLPAIAPEAVIRLRDGRRYALLPPNMLTGPEGGLEDAATVAAIRAVIAGLPPNE